MKRNFLSFLFELNTDDWLGVSDENSARFHKRKFSSVNVLGVPKSRIC